MKRAPARTLAAAGTAGLGVLAGAVLYLEVGGLPGVLYAVGICLAAVVGAAAILAGRSEATPAPVSLAEQTLELQAVTPKQPRWKRKKHIIAELQVELASTTAELEEHRRALANLATQLSRETEAAQRNAERLEQRIRELEAERDALRQLVAEERQGFEKTLNDLGGGIGRHGNELAELERELEALIAR